MSHITWYKISARSNASGFRVESRVSFQQIYLNLDRRGADTEEYALSLLRDLKAGGGEPAALSDPISLPHELQLQSESEVARLFGREFASRLAEIEPGNWTGPVRTGFGLHLVRVLERLPGRMPELDEVREKVEREWRFMERQ